LIIYARTESSYINNDKLLSYNPHPPLELANKFCEPLKKDAYVFDENSMLLHFHNIRAITPSNHDRVKKKIGSICATKNNEDIKKIVDNYDNFLDKHGKESNRYFLDTLLTHYKDEELKGISLNEYKDIDELFEEIKSENIDFYSNNDNSPCQSKDFLL
jgi:hypothetical protein